MRCDLKVINPLKASRLDDFHKSLTFKHVVRIDGTLLFKETFCFEEFLKLIGESWLKHGVDIAFLIDVVIRESWLMLQLPLKVIVGR